MLDDGSVPLQVVISVVSFILSAFFACAEYALDNLNETELKKSVDRVNSKRYSKLLKIVDNDIDYIEAMHLGRLITVFVSVALPSIIIINATVGMETYIRVLIYLTYIALFIMITSVFVYLIPRHLVWRDAVRCASTLVNFINFFRIIFYPFVMVNYFIAKSLMALFRIKIVRTPEKITEDSIISLVNEGQETGAIDDDEREMISNVFDLDNKTAVDVMTHRTEICAIEVNDDFDKIINIAVTERYSRIPVYKDTIDNIIGIIHFKDMLGIDRATFKVTDIMREVSYVPESQKLDELLNILRNSNNHLAVVVDEYGGTSGIVTMEDILEELVGNIRDEYDSEEAVIEQQEITALGDGNYLVAGMTDIETVNEQLSTDIPDDEYDTLSGFLIGLLGEIPEENTHPAIKYNNITFTVENSNDKVIILIKVSISKEPEGEEHQE